jgi:hypothetical protein
MQLLGVIGEQVAELVESQAGARIVPHGVDVASHGTDDLTSESAVARAQCAASQDLQARLVASLQPDESHASGDDSPLLIKRFRLDRLLASPLE